MLVAYRMNGIELNDCWSLKLDDGPVLRWLYAKNDSSIKIQYYSKDEWREHTEDWTFQSLSTCETLEEFEVILKFALDNLDYRDSIDNICANFPLEDYSDFRETPELQKLVWDIHELEEYGLIEFWAWSKNIALSVDRKKIMREMQEKVIQRRTEQLIEEYERGEGVLLA